MPSETLAPGSWQWREVAAQYRKGFIGGHPPTDTLWFVSESSGEIVWTGVQTCEFKEDALEQSGCSVVLDVAENMQVLRKTV